MSEAWNGFIKLRFFNFKGEVRMSKLGRNRKGTMAVALLGALAFGANAQAMNSGVKDVKTEQTPGAVGGARIQPKKINWNKIVRIGGSTVAGLAALEAIRELIGGFTDSKLGSYSIGRAIRNRVKKNEQLDSGEHSDEKLNERNNEEENDEKDETLNAVLGKFQAVGNVELFGKFKVRLRNAYQSLNNNKYQLKNCKNNDFRTSVANAIINFITNTKKNNTKAQVTEITNNLNISFKLLVKFEGKDYPVFLLEHPEKDDRLIVVFDCRKIIDFK